MPLETGDLIRDGQDNPIGSKPPQEDVISAEVRLRQMERNSQHNLPQTESIENGDRSTLATETLGLLGIESTNLPHNAEDFWNVVNSEANATIVGGQLITPTAVRVGETSTQPAMERGWLAAITGANGQTELSDNERQTNVQAIVDAAKAAGISEHTLRSHLEGLGITTVKKDAIVDSVSKSDTSSGVSTEQSISTEQAQAYLDEIELQIPKVKDGSLSPSSFQQIVSEAKQKGVPIDQLRALLTSNGVQASEADTQVDNIIKNENNNSKPLNESEKTEMKRNAARKAQEQRLADESSLYEWLNNDFNEVDPNDIDLMLARNQLPDSIGRRFDAHGLAKVSSSFQFDGLINLLDNGIDPNRPFYSMNLFSSDENDAAAAMGASGPYDNGGFIVIGRPRGQNESSGEHFMKNSGIAGVLVNREWYDAIPRLQQAYPNVRFIRADAMTEELTKWVEEVDKAA